jgi:hypothetical protein
MTILGKRLRYFAEIGGNAITLDALVFNERGKTRVGAFSFAIENPDAPTAALLVPGALLEVWAGFVAHADYGTTIKGDLTKMAGWIENIRRTSPSPGRVVYEVEGSDRSAIAHRTIVNDVWTSKRPDQVVTEAWTAYGPAGVTFTNVATSGITLDTYRVPHDSLFELMEQMADITGWIWRLDAANVLHFKPSADDYYGSITYDTHIASRSLQIANDSTNMANRVWVFGSTAESDLLTEKWLGDGTQYNWKLSYSPIMSTVAVRKGGVGQTVGVDGVDTFAAFDVLVNPDSQVLRFNPTSPPAGAALIEIDYKYGIPVIARRENAASIATYGVYEHVIVDAKIINATQASERARAHLSEYGTPRLHGECQIYLWDIRAGQSFTLVHPTFGLNHIFTVDEIDREVRGPEEAVITLKFRGSPGPIHLQDKIRELDQRLHSIETGGIPADGVVNTYQSFSETINPSDSLTTTYGAAESRVGHALVNYSEVGT